MRKPIPTLTLATLLATPLISYQNSNAQATDTTETIRQPKATLIVIGDEKRGPTSLIEEQMRSSGSLERLARQGVDVQFLSEGNNPDLYETHHLYLTQPPNALIFTNTPGQEPEMVKRLRATDTERLESFVRRYGLGESVSTISNPYTQASLSEAIASNLFNIEFGPNQGFLNPISGEREIDPRSLDLYFTVKPQTSKSGFGLHELARLSLPTYLGVIIKDRMDFAHEIIKDKIKKEEIDPLPNSDSLEESQARHKEYEPHLRIIRSNRVLNNTLMYAQNINFFYNAEDNEPIAFPSEFANTQAARDLQTLYPARFTLVPRVPTDEQIDKSFAPNKRITEGIQSRSLSEKERRYLEAEISYLDDERTAFKNLTDQRRQAYRNLAQKAYFLPPNLDRIPERAQELIDAGAKIVYETRAFTMAEIKEMVTTPGPVIIISAPIADTIKRNRINPRGTAAISDRFYREMTVAYRNN
jgi:hypothetical protein